MRIIQLDETQTDISTQAHFHPLAIRLYGQHGINATGPTGSEVRQASPPPPKPLLFPFIPSSSPTALHSYSSHRDTHFFKKPTPIKYKLHSQRFSRTIKTTAVSTFAVYRAPFELCTIQQRRNSKVVAVSYNPNLSLPTVQLCTAQRQY